jgi:hypothetical protein
MKNWLTGGTVQGAGAAALLRAVFGNPFRPATLASGCRTPAVVALAQALDVERRFADLPVLADVL